MDLLIDRLTQSSSVELQAADWTPAKRECGIQQGGFAALWGSHYRSQSDGPVRTYNVRPNVIGRVDLAPVEVQKASHRLNAYS